MKQIQVSASFIILWITVLFLDTEQLCSYFLLSAVVHEFGHLAAIRLCGAQVLQFRLSALGGVIRYYLPIKTRLRELCICLSGCLFGAIFAVFAYICKVPLLCGASTILTAFNLLPLSFLDGGRAWNILIGEHTILLFLEYGTIILMLCIGVGAVLQWRAYGLFCMACILAFLQQSHLHRRKNKGMI